jgi:hypothetical protein
MSYPSPKTTKRKKSANGIVIQGLRDSKKPTRPDSWLIRPSDIAKTPLADSGLGSWHFQQMSDRSSTTSPQRLHFHIDDTTSPGRTPDLFDTTIFDRWCSVLHGTETIQSSKTGTVLEDYS